MIRRHLTNLILYHCLTLLLLILPALWLHWPLPVQAHARQHPYYMATDGIDRGRCLSPLHPCRTFAYTLAQTIGKEEVILVATGEYRVNAAELQAIVGGLVAVEGGYRRADLFAQQDAVAHPTYLVGVDERYRAQLITQGFTLRSPTSRRSPAATTRTISGQRAAAPATCVNGLAAAYPCHNIDLLSHLSLADLSSTPTAANDIWGHRDLNDGREYALIGLRNGTAIIDVTVPTQPVEITTIAGANNAWRDIATYQFFDQSQQRWRTYAYVTTEATGQGMQILDLSQLPLTVTVASTYHGISRAHNVYLGEVDYSTGVASGAPPHLYLLGSDLDRGAFRILDLAVPDAPTSLSTPSATMQYAHEATTFVITDTRTLACGAGHNPCTVLVDFNENTVDLWDVTAANTPYLVSTTAYDGANYAHSGWWSTDKRWLFIQDELDEYRVGHNTRLWVMDLSNLLTPTVQVAWEGPTHAIDHNGYVIGNRYFMSNYERGLTVLDVTQPTAATDIGFFDTYPTSDDAHFNGAWGVYPFLPSGTLLVSDIQSGLFVLRLATTTLENTPTPAATVTPTAAPAPNATAVIATPTATPSPLPTASPTPTLVATVPSVGNSTYRFLLPLVTR